MFETLTPDGDDRGQVGIGTLIVFIALVLVAAVAAGVLVNTAGLLQSRAEDTGSDAQAQVSNQIDVVSATGTVNASGKEVTELRLTVKKSAGSDALNLSRSTIEYTSDSDARTLTAGSGFTLSNVKGTTSGQVLDDGGDRARITIDLGVAGQPSNLKEGSEATLRIVDQSGASTVYGVNIPDAITGDYVLV